jgi:hypothetical protein
LRLTANHVRRSVGTWIAARLAARSLTWAGSKGRPMQGTDA